jgi:hypothetical protein
MLLSVIAFGFQSCEVPPEVRVQPTSPPTFTFSRGTLVSMLLVYHLQADQKDKGVFLDEVLNDKANLTWMLEGTHNQEVPIVYGLVPVGMKETVQAKPLIEGESYLGYVASLVGVRFIIRNGIAEQVKPIEGQHR